MTMLTEADIEGLYGSKMLSGTELVTGKSAPKSRTSSSKPCKDARLVNRPAPK